MNGHRSVSIVSTSVDRMTEIINSFQELSSGEASRGTLFLAAPPEKLPMSAFCSE
jgi:hypothetical protein